MYIYTARWLNNYVVQLCPFWCNSYGARLSRLLTTGFVDLDWISFDKLIIDLNHKLSMQPASLKVISPDFTVSTCCHWAPHLNQGHYLWSHTILHLSGAGPEGALCRLLSMYSLPLRTLSESKLLSVESPESFPTSTVLASVPLLSAFVCSSPALPSSFSTRSSLQSGPKTVSGRQACQAQPDSCISTSESCLALEVAY